jgi:hypothetical protein
MTGRFLLVLMLAACGSSPPPEPARPAERPTSVRAEVPAEILKLLPKHGVYVAGGGEKSPVFRIIVDTDAKTIYTGSAPPASPLHGPLPEERTRELTPRNEQHLMQLCADAWSETPPASPPERVVGYDEVFVIADGDRVFFLQGKGPITRPRAVKAIEALRAAGAL